LRPALRDQLGDAATQYDGLSKLIGKAQGRSWITTAQGVQLRAGTEFRNRIVHAKAYGVLTLPLVAGALETAHTVIAKIYAQPAGSRPS
jgi:hypothetical protein